MKVKLQISTKILVPKDKGIYSIFYFFMFLLVTGFGKLKIFFFCKIVLNTVQSFHCCTFQFTNSVFDMILLKYIKMTLKPDLSAIGQMYFTLHS